MDLNGAAGATFEDWKLVLLSPWGTTGLALAAVGIAAALALSIWSLRKQQRWSVRLLLAALRALALAGVLLLVLQPAIQLRSVTRIPNHLALLLDRSRSMGVREAEGGARRIDRSAALLKRSTARLDAWSRSRVLDLYAFGAQLRSQRREDLVALEADAPATHVRTALSKIRQRYKGKDLAAIIMISDGIDNGRFGVGPLKAPAKRFLKGLGAPVHTVWVGKQAIRDLAITEVYSDDFAFVRNAVHVEAELIALGFSRRKITVALESEGNVIAQREVEVGPDESRYRVRFQFVPQRVGKYVFRVVTPLQAGEALANNNSRSFVLKVIRDRIRVLQVCGRPSWDQRFLRRLLKRDPNIDLIAFFILRTPTDLTLVPPSELSLIPFPTEELFEKELGSFDLVLLQNFNYGPYGIGIYLPHLKRFVLQGGGLAMIGGDLSFSAGGYSQTQLAHVLPLKLPPRESDPARLISTEDFRPRLTAEGRDHPVLQVGRTRRETTQILAKLPPLSGVNLVRGAAPRATVLATHPALRGRDRQPMPVLATLEVGKGRTLALTTDSSWHWAFHSVGQGGTRQAYDRFWRNAIRWLIRDPELKYLRIIVQRDSVRLGAPMRGVIRAYNADYSPARGLKVTYSVSRQSLGRERPIKARERVARTNGDGEIRLELKPQRPGAYKIVANASIGGRATREDALVLVEPTGSEEREPRATPALLKQISVVTGGRYLGQAEVLPELELVEPRLLRVNWRRDMELWSRWWTLLGCIFLLGLEWAMRRRFGYL